MVAYDDELATALELADLAMRRIATGRPSTVRTKANAADLVTETDHEIEHQVRDVLGTRFPDHAIVGEELGGSPAADEGLTWYVDPVDGTTSYASGLPWCSFSLALAVGDRPVLGVVADPFRGEVFSAVHDGPALCNGTPVRCRDVTSLAGEIVVTEWAAYQPWPGMTDMLRHLSTQMCTARVMGSSALSLVSVAAGRAAGGVLGRFHAIDGLAAAFIASRAGAVVLAEDATPTLFPPSGGILVSAPGVSEEIWRAWSQPSTAGSW
jgi:myo-inositol-1(or 4)-monophosphatase